MTRDQAIKSINADIEQLADERVKLLAELAQSWRRGSVFQTFSAEEKAEIHAALDELDRGEGQPWDSVRADLKSKIAATRK